MTLNSDMFEAGIDRAAMIRLYENGVQDKVKQAYTEHNTRMSKLLNEGKNPEPEIKRVYREIQDIHKRSLLEIARSQVNHTVTTFKRGIGKIWRVEPPAPRVAENLVLKNKLSDSGTLEAGWAGVERGERMRVERIIRSGIADGLKPSQIARQVSRQASIPMNQANALVTTSITSVVAQADFAVYEANAKALKGWQYVAILDRRTTPVCAHRDGKVYGMDQRQFLPPAHFRCRSKTVPAFKSWEDLGKMEGVANIRKRNLQGLSDREKEYYDGLAAGGISYSDWLRTQPKETQLRHLGSDARIDLFSKGALRAEDFGSDGRSVPISVLRADSDSGRTAPGDTKKFAAAKERLDALNLGANTPDDFFTDPTLVKRLTDYYELQSREVEGTLSLINYRGNLIGNKAQTKRRVLNSPPRDDQVRFNPVTGKYDDARMFMPSPAVHEAALRRVRDSNVLLERDKLLIEDIDNRLSQRMHINERSVILDNLRIIIGRYRQNPEPWQNFKAVAQAQIKFDVMNISEAMETHLRRDTNLLRRLNDKSYVDPVLGPTQLSDLHDNLPANIIARNQWEDNVAPKIAKELGKFMSPVIAAESPIVWKRLNDSDMRQFFLRFANRLALADGPDRDGLAVSLGRDLYHAANLNGDRNKWYELGIKILEAPQVSKFYTIESMGVQKRRMKKKTGSGYFGPYYDTQAFNILVTDPRIREYSQLVRKIDVGMRVPGEHRLHFRENTKTYWLDRGIRGWYDTRIPVTSDSGFGDFNPNFFDKNTVQSLEWASQAKYRIDKDFHSFIRKLMAFEDDRGNAKKYNELNEYRKYITERGDAYERFKAMEWLEDRAFSNTAFVDHRGRVYDRGLIGPQSGESFKLDDLSRNALD